VSEKNRGARFAKWLEPQRIVPIATLAVVVVALLGLFTVQSRAPQPLRPPPPLPDIPPYRYVMQTDPANSRILELYTVQDGALVSLASYPITPDDLPEADRRILRQGLALRDSVELQSALEDYLPS
jgi:hypothetical protein